MAQVNYIISEAGKIFKYDNQISFKIPADAENYEVLDIDMTNIRISSKYIFVDNKFIINRGYDKPLKGVLINKIYSNDDELAIMLNYQQSKTADNKAKLQLLQDWRVWFGELAKRIDSMLSNN